MLEVGVVVGPHLPLLPEDQRRAPNAPRVYSPVDSAPCLEGEEV